MDGWRGGLDGEDGRLEMRDVLERMDGWGMMDWL
jgi:hypothetical protein